MTRFARYLGHELEALAFLVLVLPVLFVLALLAEAISLVYQRTDDPGFPTEDPLGILTPDDPPG